MTVETHADRWPGPPTAGARPRMKRRYKAGIVLLVLMVLSSASLALHAPWLEGRYGVATSASELATTLKRLPGVDSATATYDPVGLPEATVTVTARFAARATPGQWGAADRAVRAAARSDSLRSSTVTAVFTQKAGRATVRIEPLEFPASTVVAEVEGWQELLAVVGDRVSLDLGRSRLYSGSGAPLTREYSVASDADMAQVAAAWSSDLTPQADDLPISWTGPGASLATFPTPAVMRTVASLSTVVALAPPKPGTSTTGTFAVILADVRGYKVEVDTLEAGRFTAGPLDSDAAAAARVAFATGASAVVRSVGGEQASLTRGTCSPYRSGAKSIATTLVTTAADTRLEAQLRVAGFAMPPGVRAGACRAAS